MFEIIVMSNRRALLISAIHAHTVMRAVSVRCEDADKVHKEISHAMHIDRCLVLPELTQTCIESEGCRVCLGFP